MSRKASQSCSESSYGFQGSEARLIPNLKDGDREGRLTSIFLAVLTAVPEYRKVIIESLGRRVGSRAKLFARTEIVFNLDNSKGPKKDNQRPDGALILETGQKSWRALIEAKANNAVLDRDQIEGYLKRAREQKFDALITISNQFVAMPTHHPLEINKNYLRSVNLYHWSWTYLVTQAKLLLKGDQLLSDERRFLLDEMVKHFEHEKSGVQGFTQMNEDWKDLVAHCRSASPISHSDSKVQNTVASWHQEQRELCLKLWPLVRTEVVIKLPRAHKKDAAKRLESDSRLLAKDSILRSEIVVPNAAAPIKVDVDIKSRQIRCSMTLKAPDDKPSGRARTTWLLNQLAKSVPAGGEDEHDVLIIGKRPGWTSYPSHTVRYLRNYRAAFDSESGQSGPPTSFEIRIEKNMNNSFSNRKGFIRSVEELVPHFYNLVGQHLIAWVPPAPRMTKDKPAEAMNIKQEQGSKKNNSLRDASDDVAANQPDDSDS